MPRDKNELKVTPTSEGLQLTIRWPVLVVFIAGMLTASTLGSKALSWLFPQLDVGNKERVQLKARVSELENKVQEQDEELQNCKAIEDFLLKKRADENMVAPDYTIIVPRHRSSKRPSLTPQSGVKTPVNEALDHGQA